MKRRHRVVHFARQNLKIFIKAILFILSILAERTGKTQRTKRFRAIKIEYFLFFIFKYCPLEMSVTFPSCNFLMARAILFLLLGKRYPSLVRLSSVLLNASFPRKVPQW